ncbi:MAG: hypothetical protein H0U52_06735 [Chloroflexi bacterium]|nr:hypothetical protein [Chloroflexota bacterium]
MPNTIIIAHAMCVFPERRPPMHSVDQMRSIPDQSPVAYRRNQSTNQRIASSCPRWNLMINAWVVFPDTHRRDLRSQRPPYRPISTSVPGFHWGCPPAVVSTSAMQTTMTRSILRAMSRRDSQGHRDEVVAVHCTLRAIASAAARLAVAQRVAE